MINIFQPLNYKLNPCAIGLTGKPMTQIIIDTVWQTLGVCALIGIPVIIYLKNKEDENNY